VEEIIAEESISVGMACRIVGLNRSMFYYNAIGKDDSLVENKLLELAEKKPTRGFGHYFGLIRNEGLIWNRKRVKRVYKKLQLNLRRKRKRRVPARVKQPLINTQRMNQTWSMDFMHDTTESGRKVKVLNVIDDFNREALAIDVDYSIPAEGVKSVLMDIIERRGKPEEIRTDNGPEFISAVLTQFCEANNIRLKYTQPGKPVQNAFIERFNRTFREDVLDAYLFRNIEELIAIKEEWMNEYNENHPHKSLGGISPKQYLKKNNSYFHTV
jgi:putative transposase